MGGRDEYADPVATETIKNNLMVFETEATVYPNMPWFVVLDLI